MLQQAKSSPDLNNYLIFILSSSEQPSVLQYSASDYHAVRSAAGIMLKNNVKSDWNKIPPASLEIVKKALPIVLQDKNSQVRSFAGSVITEIVKKGGLLGWPEIIPQLIETFSNASGQASNEAQEGAMAAMSKICEDNARALSREVNGQRPLNIVLPQLIAATKSPLMKVRAAALTAINVFTPQESQAMLNSIDDLLQHLFILAEDNSDDVRRQVCRAFCNLVEIRPDKLIPHLSGLVDYIITQQRSDDEDLAIEAAEFWLAMGEHANLWKALEPYLGKIIPLLLECMVYSGDDIALLGGQSDDEDEDDRQEDIKPAFAKKDQKRTNANGEEAAAKDQAKAGYEKADEMNDELEEGEIEDEFDDDGDENPEDRWTVRKGSAAALDVFASDFRGPVFEAILPYLSQNLKHEDWPKREAAVLALGAVADGCMDTVAPHLPELIPYLLTLLEDPEPVVRQITCWTLGRYSGRAANFPDPQKEQLFVPIMDGLLRKMLDKNKKVQEAGASAFANLEEQARKKLEPYCGPIIQQFVQCFAKYKDRNMYVLYDCLQTLAEHMGPVLARPELANPLMGSLIARYEAVSNDAREVFPLFECLSYVSLALGYAFAPYATPIFMRCINIIHTNLEQSLAVASGAGADEPDKDFLITSLDLLSSIIQALEGEKATELVKSSQPSFFELLSFCIEDPTDEVRQSGYALLGDCARFVYPLLSPHLQNVVPILLRQLDMDNILDEEIDRSFGVVNNACWASGEIALQHGKGMQPWVTELLQRFVEIMSNPRVPPSLCENAAIALGRLGQENYEQLAPALSTFAEDFLNTMEEVTYTEEKATAFRGFTMIVIQNPQAMEKVLLKYFTAMAQYEDLGLVNPLKQSLQEVFQHVSFSSVAACVACC